MQSALVAALKEWPGVQHSEAEFAAHLAKVGASAEAVEAHGVDLVLASACAAGDGNALSVFERLHISRLASHVTRLRLSPEQLNELEQLIRVGLFTGSSARILRYSGKGPLAAWLRILAIRMAIDKLQAHPIESQLDATAVESFVAHMPLRRDPAVKIIWEPLLRDAIEDSLAGLPMREKTVLRLHYVEGLNIEAIGMIFQVHRATVARWLLAIRSAVMATIRERLSLKLPSTTSDIRRVFAQLQSELQLTISRVLGSANR